MSSDDLKNTAAVWGGDESTSTRRRSSSPPARPQQPSLIDDTTPSEAPPSYTPNNATTPRATASSSRQTRAPLNPLHELSRVANIPFQHYSIPGAKQSADGTTITTSHDQFLTRPDSLATLLTQQAALPPRPTLRITGTHKAAHTVGDVTTDFDLTLSLLTLLDLQSTPTGDPLGSRLRFTTPPPRQPSSQLFNNPKRSSQTQQDTEVKQWARHFCTNSASENRSFTLTRITLDFHPTITRLLEGHIRTLLASLKYRGKVDVSFPIENSTVTVHKQPGNWFVSMLRLYPEKKYEVAEAVWDIGDSTADGGDDGAQGKREAERWWRAWEGVVRNAVLKKEKGKIGVEDWMGWKMGGDAPARVMEWGGDGMSEYWER
jgi:hypothetical protein